MKNILSLTVLALTLMGWNSLKSSSESRQTIDFHPYHLSKVDAEKILGQSAALTDSISTNKNNVAAYQCTYTADDKDTNTGKLGAVYFMIEQYDNLSAAKEKYQTFKTSNQNSSGFKMLSDMGDEGWFHTDGQNFCLIISIKNNKMMRLKVNKLTSKTSINAFHDVAAKITDNL